MTGRVCIAGSKHEGGRGKGGEGEGEGLGTFGRLCEPEP